MTLYLKQDGYIAGIHNSTLCIKSEFYKEGFCEKDKRGNIINNINININVSNRTNNIPINLQCYKSRFNANANIFRILEVLFINAFFFIWTCGIGKIEKVIRWMVKLFFYNKIFEN